MSERYSKLFALSENLYSAGAPVVIAAGALQKDNQTGKVFAQLKIRNIQDKAIKAATVKITPFDTVGKPLGGTVDYQYLDLAAGRDTDFGQKTPVMLKEAATRSFAVSVSEVIFSDNSIWTASDEAWEPLSAPVTPEKEFTDGELAKQYRVKYGTDCTCVFKKEKDLWRCACGAVNHDSERNCHSCQRELAALAALNVEELKADRDKRLAAEQKKAAEEKAAAEAQAKKTKKIAMIVAPIVVVAIVAAVLISNFVKAQQEEAVRLDAYNAAVALAEAGQYDEAIAAFAELGDYKDSIEWANQNVAYEKAIYLLDCAERGDDAGLKVSTQTKPKTDATPNTTSPGSVEQEIPDTIPAKCAQKAITVLKAIGDYRDSMVLIERANTIIEIEIEAEKEGYTFPVKDAYGYSTDPETVMEMAKIFGDDGDGHIDWTENSIPYFDEMKPTFSAMSSNEIEETIVGRWNTLWYAYDSGNMSEYIFEEGGTGKKKIDTEEEYKDFYWSADYCLNYGPDLDRVTAQWYMYRASDDVLVGYADGHARIVFIKG